MFTAARRKQDPRNDSRAARRPAVLVVACAAILAIVYMIAYPAAASASAAQAAEPAVAAAGTQPPACPDGSGRTPLYRDTDYSFTQRAADLVSCMTLRRKSPSCTPTARRPSRGSACSSTPTGAKASTGEHARRRH